MSMIRFAPKPKPASQSTGKRGRPSKGQAKVTLRLDPDLLAKYRATGDGWQARINEALRKAML